MPKSSCLEKSIYYYNTKASHGDPEVTQFRRDRLALVLREREISEADSLDGEVDGAGIEYTIGSCPQSSQLIFESVIRPASPLEYAFDQVASQMVTIHVLPEKFTDHQDLSI